MSNLPIYVYIAFAGIVLVFVLALALALCAAAALGDRNETRALWADWNDHHDGFEEDE